MLFLFANLFFKINLCTIKLQFCYNFLYETLDCRARMCYNKNVREKIGMKDVCHN